MKKLALALSIFLPFIMFSGCTQEQTSQEASKQLETFTIGRLKFEGSLPSGMSVSDNLATQYVEQQAGVKAIVQWQSPNIDQYNSLAIATEDMPDVMIVNKGQFNELVKKDMIADLTEAYNQHASELLQEIYATYGPELFEEVTVDGKIMGIPGTNISHQQDVLWIRKDWLEKSGLSVPNTVEEVLQLAAAFQKVDYDQTGEAIGLSMLPSIEDSYNTGLTLHPLAYSMGAYPDQWIKKDGLTVYGSIQPEMKTVLKQFHQAYQQKILDKDFVYNTPKEIKNKITAGKLGIVFFPWWAPDYLLKDSLANKDTADWLCVPAPVNGEGQTLYPENYPILNIVVVRKDYKKPENIIQSINYSQDFVFQDSAEAKQFAKENKLSESVNWHHQLVQIPTQIGYKDSIRRIYDQLNEAVETKDDSKVGSNFSSVLQEYYEVKNADTFSNLDKWGNVRSRFDGEAAALNERYQTVPVEYVDPTILESNEWQNLKALEEEAFIKIVTGEEPIDYFDEFVATWSAQGGETITQQIQKK